MKKKKTAVHWLVNEYAKAFKIQVNAVMLESILQALQMEREQIIDAYVNIGFTSDYDYAIAMKKKAEQYYNETYGGQDE